VPVAGSESGAGGQDRGDVPTEAGIVAVAQVVPSVRVRIQPTHAKSTRSAPAAVAKAVHARPTPSRWQASCRVARQQEGL